MTSLRHTASRTGEHDQRRGVGALGGRRVEALEGYRVSVLEGHRVKRLGGLAMIGNGIGSRLSKNGLRFDHLVYIRGLRKECFLKSGYLVQETRLLGKGVF